MVVNHDILQKFLSFRRIAVVGVSRHSHKYGYRIYFDLKKKGYEVYAINPHISEISGDPCYPGLAGLPVRVDVVNLVVPPEIGFQIVEDCLKLDLTRLWFQPGAASESLLQYCRSKRLTVVSDQCMMFLSQPDSFKGEIRS